MAIKPYSVATVSLLILASALTTVASAGSSSSNQRLHNGHYYYPTTSSGSGSGTTAAKAGAWEQQQQTLPQLGSDVQPLIPRCAQDCFRSFAGLSFASAGCGSNGEAASLSCICTQEGNLGFTAGEGAIQCLVGAQSVGLCSESDATLSRLQTAYNMCVNVRGAASPTHQTIMATLEVNAGTQLGVPAPNPTTIITQITAMPQATTTGTVQTDLVSPTDTATTSRQPQDNDAEAAAGATEQENKSSNSKLSQGQIAGLTVGIVATAGVAFGAIFLARRVRRRRFPDTETGFIMRNERLKKLSMHVSNRISRFRGGDISGPIPGKPAMAMATGGRAPPSRFPMGSYAPSDWRPDTIGVAIAHPGQNVPRTGPPQQPLPAATMSSQGPAPAGALRAVGTPPKTATATKAARKPTLSLTIPPERSTPSPRPAAPQPAFLGVPNGSDKGNGARLRQGGGGPSRRGSNDTVDTNMTEFEEDGQQRESSSGRASSQQQIWRPPPTTPLSASAVYVADRFGNWVLADERQRKRISVVELEGTTPTTTTATGTRPRDEDHPALRNNNNDVVAPTAPLKDRRGGGDNGGGGGGNKNLVLAPPAEISSSSTRYNKMTDLNRFNSVGSSVYSEDENAMPWLENAPPMPSLAATSRQQNQYSLVPPPLAPRKASSPSYPSGSTNSLAPQQQRQQQQQQRGKRPIYSPVLNPFLDDSRLSPVVESPSTRRSSSSQRNTPPPMRSPARRLMTPSPVIKEPVSPPGQPSPTLGLADIATSPSPRARQQQQQQQQQQVPHIAYLSSHPPDRYPSSQLIMGTSSGTTTATTGLPPPPPHSPGQFQRRMSARTQQKADLARERFQREEQNLRVETSGLARVDPRASSSQARTAYTAETASTWSAGYYWNGPGGSASGQGSGDAEKLPSTPTWMPKLTLARKGDDLYLNVQ